MLAVSRGESFHDGGGLVEAVVVLCLCLLNSHMTHRTGLNLSTCLNIMAYLNVSKKNISMLCLK